MSRLILCEARSLARMAKYSRALTDDAGRGAALRRPCRSRPPVRSSPAIRATRSMWPSESRLMRWLAIPRHAMPSTCDSTFGSVASKNRSANGSDSTPLAQRLPPQHFIHQQRCALSHSPRPAALRRERSQLRYGSHRHARTGARGSGAGAGRTVGAPDTSKHQSSWGDPGQLRLESSCMDSTRIVSNRIGV